MARYGGTMPSERVPFTPSSILFRPQQKPLRCIFYNFGHSSKPTSSLWWRRRVPPPGPIGLLRYPFIAIAGEPAAHNIANRGAVGKMTERKLDEPQQVSHAFAASAPRIAPSSPPMVQRAWRLALRPTQRYSARPRQQPARLVRWPL